VRGVGNGRSRDGGLEKGPDDRPISKSDKIRTNRKSAEETGPFLALLNNKELLKRSLEIGWSGKPAGEIPSPSRSNLGGKMTQKVWFIDDADWQEAPDKIGNNASHQEKKEDNSRPLAISSTKNPALSFSFSMIVWGSGQMYSGAYRPGSIFMVLMVVFYGTLSAMVFSWESASRFVTGTGIPTPVLLSGVGVYLLAGLILWLINAVDAYYRTVRLRLDLFWGVDNKLWPPICSLIFPGWGQFLNGQPNKGLFFLLFGSTGISSIFGLAVSPSVWPLLKAGPAGPVFELCLLAALLLVPVSLLMWIISAYDSFMTCRVRGSLQPGYRKRKQGVLKNLLPRTTAVLSLLLVISVGMQCLPKEYYLNSLEKIRIETLRDNMQIIPELAGKVIELIGR
jgi:TM2 domain-containing membrane protein YozV